MRKLQSDGDYLEALRNEVIEECARVVENYTAPLPPYDYIMSRIATAIRKLKDKL